MLNSTPDLGHSRFPFCTIDKVMREADAFSAFAWRDSKQYKCYWIQGVLKKSWIPLSWKVNSFWKISKIRQVWFNGGENIIINCNPCERDSNPLMKFKSIINSLHKNIKTMEVEENKSIIFLDLTIIKTSYKHILSIFHESSLL